MSQDDRRDETRERQFDTKFDTKLVRLGRDPQAHSGAVNIPVYRASTFLWPSTSASEELAKHRNDADFRGSIYGRYGNPTTIALEDAIAELEGGFRALLAPCGLAAIAGALFACTKAGDHLLMVDTCYWNTRHFCDSILSRSGVETTYYDPVIGGAIADLIRPSTRAIFIEAPGSQTFEMQDVPAIAAAAHAKGAV